MTSKQKLYSHCLLSVSEKIEVLKKAIEELTEGLQNDSKSSAGDKYETSRAMAQIEQEKTVKQLQEALEQKSSLEKLNINITSSKIIKGSMVKTNTVNLFICIALGKISINNTIIFAISPQSPLGAALMGLKINDTAIFNGTKYFIQSIE